MLNNKNNHKNEVVIIRGLPGSGKSTLAKSMVDYLHFEADMYLEINGEYVYDASKIKQAHDWCVASAKNALEKGANAMAQVEPQAGQTAGADDGRAVGQHRARAFPDLHAGTQL